MSRWWGAVNVDEGGQVQVRIGPLRLWVERQPREWRTLAESTGDPFDTSAEVVVASSQAPPLDDTEELRVAVTRTEAPLHVTPALPDRNIVVRPEAPWRLLPGHEALLYVRCPCWLQLAQGPRRDDLARMPCYRPSDTWFGPNTLEGELCYALRTRARRSLEGVDAIPFRFTTAVLVRNKASDTLVLERIKLPVDQLTLMGTADGWLATDKVQVDREDDGHTVRVHATGEPPPEMKRPEVLVQPAQVRRGGILGAVGAWLR
jgi:hypothetical protein